MTRPAAGTWGWGLVLLLAAPTAIAAQVTATPPAPDSFLALVVPRDLAEIQQDIAAADRARTAAAEAERTAESLRAGATARIEAEKQGIESTKNRKDVAKRAHRDAEQAALEAEVRARERQKDLLERRKELRESEIDLAKRRVALAAADRQALDFERQLALKRAERAAVPGASADAVRLDQVTLDLEQAVLDARKQRTELAGDVAGREKRVVERQLNILQARRKRLGGN